MLKAPHNQRKKAQTSKKTKKNKQPTQNQCQKTQRTNAKIPDNQRKKALTTKAKNHSHFLSAKEQQPETTKPC